MKNCYLYKITNTVNGKLYIGITTDPQKRKTRHFSKTGHSAFSLIRLAMDKHGRENFKFEVICIGEKDYILDLEVKAIALYRTCEKRFGYNIKPGGQSGRGYAVNGSKRDVPVFVSGFWFPNRRTATKSLNITVATFKNRQRDNTLGDIIRGREPGKWEITPCYLGGFWFPDLKTATNALNKPEGTLRSRLARGFGEEAKRSNPNSGEKCWTFGINPSDHPSAKPVLVHGEEYDSLKEAVEKTGFSKYIITSRIKNNHPDFKFL